MAQTKPKAGQFYGVSNNGTDGEFLQTDGTGGMAWASPITNPTITSIDYPGSATAANPAGGESVIINGTLFASGITCTVGGTSAVTAFNSATQITITTPAKAAGPYTVAVLNPDGGTASENNFIQYSGVPVWSTAAGTLGNVIEGVAASFQVTATEGSDTIEYAVTTGTLPTGLSLATATGAITGTAPAVSADTTTTFSITATDDENQTSASRSFSITVQNDGPSNHFNTVLYTGNDTNTSYTRNITGVGFQPDLVWIKSRDTTGFEHALFDSVRGAGASKILSSDTTGAQGWTSGAPMSAFITDGFSIQPRSPWNSNNLINKNGDDFVAWNFKAGGAAVANTDGTINSQVSANNTLGFSIVSFTGTSSNVSVGHGLDAAPELFIIKTLSTDNWWAYTTAIDGTMDYLVLNSTVAAGNGTQSLPTSSVFYQNQTNASIAYCFTSKPGFSKVGSYTGNGSANGPMVQTGFEPAFVMLKGAVTSNATNWWIFDNKRNPTNPLGKGLIANLSAAEQAQGTYLDFYSNGFAILSGNGEFNNTGDTYIYLAFAADGSTATPSLANSFAPEIYTGNGGTQAITGTGFKPDLTWVKSRNINYDHQLHDSVRGAGYGLISNNTGAQTFYNTITSFDSNGFTVDANSYIGTNASGKTFVSWNWKAGGTPSINTDGTITSIVSANQAAGFSIVKYTGNNTAGATVAHGMDAVPELIIWKSLTSVSGWKVYCNQFTSPTTQIVELQASAAVSTNTVFINGTAPSTSLITLGAYGDTNASGQDIVTYCFTSISGYSKVGTYSGTASANSITTGFEPGFIMIKRTDSAGNWVIMDSARGMGSNAYALLPNLTDSESGGWNTAFTATGFTISSAEAWINASGGTYIYLAIKEN